MRLQPQRVQQELRETRDRLGSGLEPFYTTQTDNGLQCGNKSSHHRNKATFKDNRDEYFEGHSGQDKVR